MQAGKTDDPRFASITVRQLLQHASGWRVRRAVTVHARTNYAYLLLGRIIEQVTGQSYQSWMQATILGPVGAIAVKMGRTPLGLRDALDAKPADYRFISTVAWPPWLL